MEAALLRAAINVSKPKEDVYAKVLEVFKPNAEFDNARREANLKLREILEQLIFKHPEQRFSQILQNYGFVNERQLVEAVRNGTEYETTVWDNEALLEPVALLKRVQDRINDLKNSKG